MKKFIFVLITILLIASTTNAATHYVDADAAGGGDGSLSTPWNSIAQVNAHTFADGDIIDLQCGDTFDDATLALANRATGATITVQGASFNGSAACTETYTTKDNITNIQSGTNNYPIFDGDSKYPIRIFGSNNYSIIIKKIAIVGQNAARVVERTQGFYIYGATNVTIEDCTVDGEGFGGGTLCTAGQGYHGLWVMSYYGDVSISRVTLRNLGPNAGVLTPNNSVNGLVLLPYDASGTSTAIVDRLWVNNVEGDSLHTYWNELNSTILVQNSIIENGGENCVDVKRCNNVTIKDSVVRRTTAFDAAYGTVQYLGPVVVIHGVESHHNLNSVWDGVLFEGGITQEAIAIVGVTGVVAYTYDTVVKNCKFLNTGTPFYCSRFSYNFDFVNNIVINAYGSDPPIAGAHASFMYSLNTTECPGGTNLVENNTFFDSRGDADVGIYWGATRPTIFRNNVFYMGTAGKIPANFANTSGLTIDHNSYYNASDTNRLKYGGTTYYSDTNFTTWQTSHTGELSGDPGFNSVGSIELWPASSESLIVGAGVYNSTYPNGLDYTSSWPVGVVESARTDPPNIGAYITSGESGLYTIYMSAGGSNTSPYDTWAKGSTTVAAVNAMTLGGVVVINLRPGDTFSDATLDLDSTTDAISSLTVRGLDGDGKTITSDGLPILSAASHQPINFNSSPAIAALTLKDFKITDQDFSTGTLSQLIMLDGIGSFTIDNVDIDGLGDGGGSSATYGQTGIKVQNATGNGEIKNCTIENLGPDTMPANVDSNGTRGIELVGIADGKVVSIHDNNINDINGRNIEVKNWSGTGSAFIYDNDLSDGGEALLGVIATNNVSISGNEFYYSGGYTTPANNDEMIYLQGNAAWNDNTGISENYFHTTDRGAIRIGRYGTYGTRYASIHDNKFANIGTVFHIRDYSFANKIYNNVIISPVASTDSTSVLVASSNQNGSQNAFVHNSIYDAGNDALYCIYIDDSPLQLQSNVVYQTKNDAGAYPLYINSETEPENTWGYNCWYNSSVTNRVYDEDTAYTEANFSTWATISSDIEGDPSYEAVGSDQLWPGSSSSILVNAGDSSVGAGYVLGLRYTSTFDPMNIVTGNRNTYGWSIGAYVNEYVPTSSGNDFSEDNNCVVDLEFDNNITNDVSGGPSFTDEDALTFDGSDKIIGDYSAIFGGTDWISTANSSAMPLDSGGINDYWSVTGWFKPTTLTAGVTHYIVSKYTATAGNRQIAFAINQTNSQLALFMGYSTDNVYESQVFDNTPAIEVDKWYFFGLVIDNSGSTPTGTLVLKNYTDSLEYTDYVTFTNTMYLNSVDYVIGARSNGASGFIGKMDDIQWFKDALSLNEIESIYSGQYPTFEGSLIPLNITGELKSHNITGTFSPHGK